MKFGNDKKGQRYLEWKIGKAGYKRAWIQNRTGDEKDWARSGRYLNVVRVEEFHKGPAGNATDFPIFSKLPDDQILKAFVVSVSAITGCELDSPAAAD